MKIRNVLLLVLATALLLGCSCQKQTIGQDASSVSEMIDQAEPQYMAYHLSDAARVGDDIYFVSGVSFNKAQIFATEYGTENFEPFIPCFDAVCDHWDRTKCSIATGAFLKYTDKITVRLYGGELSLVLFSDYDICFSKPYSNEKSILFSSVSTFSTTIVTGMPIERILPPCAPIALYVLSSKK